VDDLDLKVPDEPEESVNKALRNWQRFVSSPAAFRFVRRFVQSQKNRYLVAVVVCLALASFIFSLAQL